MSGSILVDFLYCWDPGKYSNQVKLVVIIKFRDCRMKAKTRKTKRERACGRGGRLAGQYMKIFQPMGPSRDRIDQSDSLEQPYFLDIVPSVTTYGALDPAASPDRLG